MKGINVGRIQRTTRCLIVALAVSCGVKVGLTKDVKADGRAVDPAVFGFSASAAPAANSAALQKAIDQGTGFVRIGTPGHYLMGKPVMMPSDFTLECAKGVILEKGVRSPYILINDGAWYGHSNSNIVLRGLDDSSVAYEGALDVLRGHPLFLGAGRRQPARRHPQCRFP